MEHTNFDSVSQQGLESVKQSLLTPVEKLTYGGWMKGNGMVPNGTATGSYANASFKAWQIRSIVPKKTHEVQLALHVKPVSKSRSMAIELLSVIADSL